MKLFLVILFFSILLPLSKCQYSEKCTKDIDCIENNFCFKEKCHHKSLIPITGRDVIGFLSIIIGSAVSNAGGIGGGGLFIPILILILEFYTHEAIPISKLMIFVGSLIAFVINIRLKHPSRSTLSIDLNIAILMVPMLLLGTMIGVTMNKITPAILIVLLLTMILILNTYKTFKKALNIYKTENEEKLIKVNDVGISLATISEDNAQNNISKKEESSITKLNSHLIEVELENDKKFFRWDKLKYLLISYFSLIILSFIRGSDNFKSIMGIKICSLNYWIIYFLYVPIAIFITYLSSLKISQEIKHRIEIGFPYDEHDIKWNKNILLWYPIYAFISGVIAGFVGIGGGLIIGPLLIELGINPIISTVTCNFLVLFTSSSTSFQFTLIGMMNFSYGSICTLFSFFGSLIGTLTIHYILIVFKRQSSLVFVLCGVLIISTILLPTFSVVQFINQHKQGENILEFSNPCE